MDEEREGESEKTLPEAMETVIKREPDVGSLETVSFAKKPWPQSSQPSAPRTLLKLCRDGNRHGPSGWQKCPHRMAHILSCLPLHIYPRRSRHSQAALRRRYQRGTGLSGPWARKRHQGYKHLCCREPPCCYRRGSTANPATTTLRLPFCTQVR